MSFGLVRKICGRFWVQYDFSWVYRGTLEFLPIWLTDSMFIHAKSG